MYLYKQYFKQYQDKYKPLKDAIKIYMYFPSHSLKTTSSITRSWFFQIQKYFGVLAYLIDSEKDSSMNSKTRCY